MKSQVSDIFGEMASIGRLARGRIGVIRQRKTGKGSFHQLQCTKGGKHHVRYIREAELPAWETATENYRRFMALVDRYVDRMSRQAETEITKEFADVGKGSPAFQQAN